MRWNGGERTEETATVLELENAGVTPRHLIERLDCRHTLDFEVCDRHPVSMERTIQDVYDEAVSRFSAFDGYRTGEVVDLCQIHIFDIVARVIIADLCTRPIYPVTHSIRFCATLVTSNTYQCIEL